MKNRGVPVFNTNRADTLASHDRFDRIAANTLAKVIIQHEPADVAKLPAFPNQREVEIFDRCALWLVRRSGDGNRRLA